MIGTAVPVSLTPRFETIRTVRVNVRQHLIENASAMRSAVLDYDRATFTERRRMVSVARANHAKWRPTFGMAQRPTNLSQPGRGNIKTDKNALATITYTGSPSTSGRVTLETVDGPLRFVFSNCNWAGKCARVCVLKGGMARYDSTRNGRGWRDLVSYMDPTGWAVVRRHEIVTAANRHGGILERGDVGTELGLASILPELYADTPTGSIVRGYDYGKNPDILTGDGFTLDRHHRTVYSWNERSDVRAVNRFLKRGGNIVQVGKIRKSEPIPEMVLIGSKWWPTIDGDISDDRLNEPGGHVVIVRAKGKATTRKGSQRLDGFMTDYVYGD